MRRRSLDKSRPSRRSPRVFSKNGKTTSDYARMLGTISGLAEKLQALNRKAVRAYTPVVETILSSRSHDACHIEHTLDGLLDFCGHEPALQLYKKLCRHYFSINPVATAEYVHAYREMWDSERPAPARLKDDAQRDQGRHQLDAQSVAVKKHFHKCVQKAKKSRGEKGGAE